MADEPQSEIPCLPWISLVVRSVPCCVDLRIILPTHALPPSSCGILPGPLWGRLNLWVRLVRYYDIIGSSPFLVQVHSINNVLQVKKILGIKQTLHECRK